MLKPTTKSLTKTKRYNPTLENVGQVIEGVKGTTGKEDADGGLIGDSTIMQQELLVLLRLHHHTVHKSSR
jgi:hypothetical protein